MVLTGVNGSHWRERFSLSRASCAYGPSEAVVEAVRAIEPARQQLQAIQVSQGAPAPNTLNPTILKPRNAI
eukprot:1602163-Pyramimonas_sp.AAC.1